MHFTWDLGACIDTFSISFSSFEKYICINDESSERCNPSLTQTQNIWLMHHSCDDLYFRLFVVFLWSITLNERNERIKTHSAVILCIGSVCARLMCNVKLWLVFHSIHWLWLLSWSECFSCFFSHSTLSSFTLLVCSICGRTITILNKWCL